MAGAMAREGDMLSGHGSFPPHPFPVGQSLAEATFIEGKKVLCVGVVTRMSFILLSTFFEAHLLRGVVRFWRQYLLS